MPVVFVVETTPEVILGIMALDPESYFNLKPGFQWQEQKPPFALSPPIIMSEAALELGRQQWERAGLMWDRAVKANHFPAYADQAHPACPPP